MRKPISIQRWPERLERALAEQCEIFQRAIVLEETDSTQDAARRMSAQPGQVVTAWRQTAGRGRLGRRWQQGDGRGVAVTFTVPRAGGETMAIASAIGVARGAERLLNRRVGIKWPNDIVIGKRKLAGILIEQTDVVAMIGVGMNVGPMDWTGDVAGRGVSLADEGVEVDRLDVLAALVVEMDEALRLDEATLAREFAARDALRGSNIDVRCRELVFSGMVQRVDPFRGLSLLTESGEVWLPAAAATVLR